MARPLRGLTVRFEWALATGKGKEKSWLSKKDLSSRFLESKSKKNCQVIDQEFFVDYLEEVSSKKFLWAAVNLN